MFSKAFWNCLDTEASDKLSVLAVLIRKRDDAAIYQSQVLHKPHRFLKGTVWTVPCRK